jgi:hypothetical protein
MPSANQQRISELLRSDENYLKVEKVLPAATKDGALQEAAPTKRDLRR